MAKYAELFRNIPAQERPPLPEERESEARPGDGNTPFTLLFVDDEEGVLKALRRIFMDENYRILTALRAEDALAIMGKEPVQLVISDHRMPGMTGAQLLREIKEKWPATIRIMLTGYADVQSIMGAVNEGAVYKFITKPWNDEDLRLTVSLALQQYVLLQENKKLRELTKKQREKISKYAAVIDENKGVLASYLQQDGEIGKEELAKALKQKDAGEFPGETLVRLGLTTETNIVKTLRKHLGFEYADLKEMELAPNVVKLLPQDLCERNRIIPVRLDNKQLTLAMADPSDMPKIDNLGVMTSLKILPLIARSSDILAQLRRIHGQLEGEGDKFEDLEVLTEFEAEPLEEIDIVIDDEEEQVNVEELLGSSRVPPIVRVVNAIIAEAVRYKASDIHIEPKTKCSVIRYRIDGMMRSKIKIPTEIHLPTVSRIKILAKMDISERRLPQDGRITVKAGTRMVDIRVSTMPTINGEKVVMRILDKSASIRKLEELGVLERDLSRINILMKKPQGIIISTGPTGSGKTTMLYSILNSMLDTTRNFQTIEDPVEYFLEEANQIFIKDKMGLSFSSVLRSTMRQDPDVILVGEIRDAETADVAFKAALTGHMVLTTLHTNNSVASITRLMDMGMAPYLIASAIEGILAQRLVRRICQHCRKEQVPDQELLALLKVSAAEIGGTVYAGAGCERCNNTGYAGRTGVFEFFVMNDDFRHLIGGNYKEGELFKMARAGGMHTLLEDGLEKVRLGITTLDELLRVIGSQTRYERMCPSCQQMIEATFLFCPFCGEFKANYCTGCRMQLEEGWLVCPFCGQKKETGQDAVAAGKLPALSRKKDH
ncbi:MAG: ATPase, T2SS/T4P/T4SS family [Desulfurivibrionaceae bacterium]